MGNVTSDGQEAGGYLTVETITSGSSGALNVSVPDGDGEAGVCNYTCTISGSTCTFTGNQPCGPTTVTGGTMTASDSTLTGTSEYTRNGTSYTSTFACTAG